MPWREGSCVQSWLARSSYLCAICARAGGSQRRAARCPTHGTHYRKPRLTGRQLAAVHNTRRSGWPRSCSAHRPSFRSQVRRHRIGRRTKARTPRTAPSCTFAVAGLESLTWSIPTCCTLPLCAQVPPHLRFPAIRHFDSADVACREHRLASRRHKMCWQVVADLIWSVR